MIRGTFQPKHIRTMGWGVLVGSGRAEPALAVRQKGEGQAKREKQPLHSKACQLLVPEYFFFDIHQHSRCKNEVGIMGVIAGVLEEKCSFVTPRFLSFIQRRRLTPKFCLLFF